MLGGVVDEKMHDSLRYQVLDALPHDMEIGGDERPDEVGLHFFPSSEMRAI